MRVDVETDGAFAAQATRTALHIVKRQARRYARRPALMDLLFPGLSVAPAATMIAIAEHLIEQERLDMSRWFVRGGEVRLVNMHALLLLGRTWRRHGLVPYGDS